MSSLFCSLFSVIAYFLSFLDLASYFLQTVNAVQLPDHVVFIKFQDGTSGDCDLAVSNFTGDFRFALAALLQRSQVKRLELFPFVVTTMLSKSFVWVAVFNTCMDPR